MHASQRRELVDRHDVVLHAADPGCVLAVGNGDFAFNADITGLQTFPADWASPLATLATPPWAWHSDANPQGHVLDDALQPWQMGGRSVRLPSAGWPAEPPHAAAQWLERNPHRFNLARIGLALRHADGRPVALAALCDIEQALRLWTGSLHSRFTFDGIAVTVTTRVHPQQCVLAVSVRIDGPGDRVGIRLQLDADEAAASGRTDAVALLHADPQRLVWRRQFDATTYHLTLQSQQPLRCTASEAADGWTLLATDASGSIDLCIGFGADPWPGPLPTVAETEAAASAHWQAHWTAGGMVDFAACTDPRAAELERRVVLSQYLMAVHAAGTLPPQETGLAELSWHGKFHIEMHPWHAAHFALWGRPELLERSMGWYLQHLPAARQRAQSQGLAGARWPKMVGPDGREAPGAINPLIVWQQPHPIHLAELLWRAAPPAAQDAILQRYAEMVFDSADCIAALALPDAASGHHHIGPPVVPMQEIHAAASTVDPAFELAYFQHGLQTAQQWRERLGLPRQPHWDAVADGLAPLPQHGGLYLVAASQPELWLRAAADECRVRGAPLTLDDLLHNRCPNVDHPAFAGALGWLPGARVDAETMRRTLHRVRDDWNLDKVWGWDFGMLAMTAARLGEPALALDFLFFPSLANQWGRDGRVRWKFIHAYLPANGALLAAVAMMTAGWDSATPLPPHPGFPADGRWQVQSQGLRTAP